MLSCKEVVKIVSSETDLPFLKKAELRLHMMMCDHCSRYLAHMKILKASVANLIRNKTQSSESRDLKKLEDEIVERALANRK